MHNRSVSFQPFGNRFNPVPVPPITLPLIPDSPVPVGHWFGRGRRCLVNESTLVPLLLHVILIRPVCTLMTAVPFPPVAPEFVQRTSGCVTVGRFATILPLEQIDFIVTAEGIAAVASPVAIAATSTTAAPVTIARCHAPKELPLRRRTMRTSLPASGISGTSSPRTPSKRIVTRHTCVTQSADALSTLVYGRSSVRRAAERSPTNGRNGASHAVRGPGEADPTTLVRSGHLIIS